MSRRLVGPINVLLDGLLVAASLFLAILLRHDGQIPPEEFRNFVLVAPGLSILSVIALWLAGVHRTIWRYVSIHAVLNIAKALTVTSILLGVVNLLTPDLLFPRSVPFLFWMLQILLISGIRILGRVNPMQPLRRHTPRERQGRRRVLVFGAGDVGETLVRDLMRAGRFDGQAVGFVDDDRGKQGRTIHGLKVLGGTLDIPRIIRAHKVDEVIIAAPSAPSTLVSSIFRCCQDQNVDCKTVPSLANYVVGKSPLQQIREVRIEDLLGRQPVEVDEKIVQDFLKGRRVLVTGAGGSIGSELCRQIAKIEPGRLIALDHDENKLCYMGLDLRVIVGDVKDREGVSRILAAERPEVIFHAAAHKHVSFMEENPRAAILNNVQGTTILAEESIAHGVDTFVLISTDKAVNPTNVMGASKRLCEKVVTALAETSPKTRFNAVRFGNVLGSAGSVIPIFKRQIAAGGPLTITHPEARRYFMTIPEASQLVIQAGAFDKTGTVFVLDMGEQVKVLDVARQLIRLSGFEPDRDIPVTFTGLRPGEKLYEELLTDNERTTMSTHRKIFIWRSDPEAWSELGAACRELVSAVDREDSEAIRRRLGQLVSEYQVDAPVIGLNEVPDIPAHVAVTRALDDRNVVPADHRPVRDPVLLRAVRTVGRYAFAVPALLATGALALLHLAIVPGEPVLVQESRVGRNRRRGPRRMFGTSVPIDRRGAERRLRNVYGRPFARLRFNTVPRPHAGGMERRFYGFLRRYGLDHLPSAIHLLTGEMGVIGPRPEPVEAVDDAVCETSEYPRRFTVRPGLTGLSQVLSASDRATTEKNRIDIDKFYVAHRSLSLDLRILTRTFAVVLSGNRDEPLRLRDRLGVSSTQ
jgi:FlaA1/EpsC-like NDP-sugar epimerase